MQMICKMPLSFSDNGGSSHLRIFTGQKIDKHLSPGAYRSLVDVMNDLNLKRCN